MKKYTDANKKWWNQVTPVHANSTMYNLKAFKKGESSLQSIETEELGNVKGKTMLHLLCHFGMDTLSWARKGAIVTGSDLSDDSMKLARELSTEIGIPGKFICSDVYDLPKVLKKKFDIVFMSYGVLLWLSDIDKWAQIVANYLKKGGTFYMVELHPFTNILSDDFKLYYKYFDKGPYIDENPGTYTNWNDTNVTGGSYEWSYTMSDLINALIKAGLKIEYVHEFPYTTYDQFPGYLKKNKKGHYVLKDSSIEIPLLFSVKATN